MRNQRDLYPVDRDFDGFFDDFRRNFFKDFYPNRREAKQMSRIMDTDIHLNDDGSYTVFVDMPGFKREDIKLNYGNGLLSIFAERHKESKKEKKIIKLLVKNGQVASFIVPIQLVTLIRKRLKLPLKKGFCGLIYLS
ncbi:low molecular weight heat stress protein [Listeria aquatica FSL S10-1188]|uniref:Low molecular weight heat stress protein n=1 Tax=Listeria aquatica FSL S10-1188 TaxID=1265818 RepID=W7B6B4_9LIST|nr:Hsp20 family protein [Listeria aquatica]EUJ21472.1 low molecular weight heat stress protein [Listeria aquatica FSL S10-1188]